MDTQSPSKSPKPFILLVAIGGLTVAANWYLRYTSDEYYPKLAVLGPIALVIGGFFLLFPAFSGKPEGDRSKAAVQVAAVVVGVGLGAVNWWLLAHA